MSCLVRYLRSPEFVAAVFNFALMIALFGFELIEPLADVIFWLPSQLGIPTGMQDFARIAGLLAVCAPLMLPLTWIELAACVFDYHDVRELSSFLWLAAPNSVLWGYGVTFFFRLLKTHDAKLASRCTLEWSCRCEEREPVCCPHCGEVLPAAMRARPVGASVATGEADAAEMI